MNSEVDNEGNDFQSVDNKSSKRHCGNCEQNNHVIDNCRELKSLPVALPWEAVRTKRLCFNCIRSGHVNKDCSKASCTKCSWKHHEMLHGGYAIEDTPKKD